MSYLEKLPNNIDVKNFCESLRIFSDDEWAELVKEYNLKVDNLNQVFSELKESDNKLWSLLKDVIHVYLKDILPYNNFNWDNPKNYGDYIERKIDFSTDEGFKKCFFEKANLYFRVRPQLPNFRFERKDNQANIEIFKEYEEHFLCDVSIEFTLQGEYVNKMNTLLYIKIFPNHSIFARENWRKEFKKVF